MEKRAGCFSAMRLFMIALCVCASQVSGQTDSTDKTLLTTPRRENFWVSAGLGFGPGDMDMAATLNGWYGNNNLVVGANLAGNAQLFGDEVHHLAILVGGRTTGDHGMALFAIGPAVLGGYRQDGGFLGPVNRYDDKNEVGLASAIELSAHLPYIGIGVDLFASHSAHRSLQGITLSLQVGSLGR